MPYAVPVFLRGFFFFKDFFILDRQIERGRERECMSGRSQSGGEVNMEPAVGLDPMTLCSRLEPKPGIGQPANHATQTLQGFFLMPPFP